MQTDSIGKNITMDIILKCNPCARRKRKERCKRLPAAHLKKKTRVECECGGHELPATECGSD